MERLPEAAAGAASQEDSARGKRGFRGMLKSRQQG
jgi:hypothetical protein